MADGVRRIVYCRPWLYEKQERAFFNDFRIAVTEASTKSGKTVGALAWLLETALKGREGQQFWWVAPVYGQSMIAFRRLVRGARSLIRAINRSRMSVELVNGAVIEFKSGDEPDHLYGEDVYGVVIDEASRVKEEAWHAIRTVLTATGGPIRIIGNVKGRKNWFYALARRAESGEEGMGYSKITWRDAVSAGILVESEIEEARAVLPERVFRELYEAEPADDEGNPFGLEYIGRAVMKGLAEGPPVVWGWDLGKAVDWTVGIALNGRGEVCKFYRFRENWGRVQERIFMEVGDLPALCDSTGVGDPVVEALRKKCLRLRGVKFTAQTKQQLMEGLAMAFQEGKIRVPEGVIVDELRAFEYKYGQGGMVRYCAPEGMHDDCVDALALAWQCFVKYSAPIRAW